MAMGHGSRPMADMLSAMPAVTAWTPPCRHFIGGRARDPEPVADGAHAAHARHAVQDHQRGELLFVVWDGQPEVQISSVD